MDTASSATTDEEGRKRATIAAYVGMGASAILLIILLSNAQNGADAIFGIVFCAIGVGIQIRMLQKINRYWDDMERSDRIRTTVIAVLAPVLMYLGVFVLVLFVMFWLWGSVLPRLLGKGGASASAPTSFLRGIFSGGRPVETKDQYGNRTGWIEPDGTVKDWGGNRTGTIEPDGVTKDAYGKRTGSINLDTGEVKDWGGNRTGSIDHNGVTKDRYGNKTGSID